MGSSENACDTLRNMGIDAPLIRASYGKTVIGGIKKLPEGVREALFERVGPGLRAEVREHGMLDWMPAKHFATLVSAVAEGLGPADAKKFWKANLLASLERRLLAPLRLGAIAVYGNSPRSLLKMTPQAWELVSKHCGVSTVIDRPPGGILLRFDALPPVLAIPPMLLLWTGGSESCIARMGFEGQANSHTGSLAQGTAEIVVEWTNK
jgi:hypothetical protein